MLENLLQKNKLKSLINTITVNQFIYSLLIKDMILDGDFPWNTAGLINHSCDNNCDYDGKGLKIWVKAIKRY